MTANTLRVLNAIIGSPTHELAGADIGRSTKLATGTLYPILMRLEAARWLESEWEAGNPSAMARPRRRFYRVTGLGAARAQAEMEALQIPTTGDFAWFR